MDLLQLARGPALQWSLVILLFGFAWRLTGLLLLPWRKDFSEPRSRAMAWGALRTVVMRSWPRKEFHGRGIYGDVLGYTFHIGLAVVVFGFVPHILLIRSLTGLSWPGLPNGVIYFVGGITVAAMIAVLIRRLTHPVLRLLSNFDDYAAWLVTVAPVASGLMAFAHLGGRYETVLAVHILAAELLLAWLPFGKLGHAFLFALSRGATGAVFTRRGSGT
jgi:nitrate reductase gamma subunit